jgi:hypothetical protein
MRQVLTPTMGKSSHGSLTPVPCLTESLEASHQPLYDIGTF